MLPDVVVENLKIVFCGTAAGKRSAKLELYYAGIGNKFWNILFRTGLTPRQLLPIDYLELLEYKIGLTDLEKKQSGGDKDIAFSNQASQT
ncbi:MAG: uracil-DNA glycosylase family protein [Candidatus Zixiibacteriota bacterium]